MPKDFSRIARVGEVLKREISVAVQQEMRDPRLGLLSILDVEVTKDLKIAKVYFSLLDEDAEKVALVSKTLNDAAGFLRSHIAKRVQLRYTPRLEFVYDDTLLKGNRIQQLLDAAMNEPDSSDSTSQ